MHEILNLKSHYETLHSCCDVIILFKTISTILKESITFLAITLFDCDTREEMIRFVISINEKRELNRNGYFSYLNHR